MALSQRQEKAEALSRELHKLGAFVINPLPLAADQDLRFQVTEEKRDSVLQILRESEWSPILVGSGPRFMPNGTTPLSYTYKINIPSERTAVPDDRIIPDEIGRKEKPSHETVAIIKDWYGLK